MGDEQEVPWAFQTLDDLAGELVDLSDELAAQVEDEDTIAINNTLFNMERLIKQARTELVELPTSTTDVSE